MKVAIVFLSCLMLISCSANSDDNSSTQSSTEAASNAAPITPPKPNAANEAQPKLKVVTLAINARILKTELAVSPMERYMGLSFRKQLADNEAMLFVYENERPLTFTMRNTLLPLSIAYIGEDLVINEIHDMNVGPDQLFPSKMPARYALEVNQGWFKANGVKAGDKIVLQ